MFNVPPTTRFDARFKLFGIPVRVHPLFWLLPIFFGLGQSGLDMVFWVLIVFFSILVHELGHSFAMRMFGVKSNIVLHLMGGLAIPAQGTRTNRMMRNQLRWVFVAFAGPLAGFLLVAIAAINVYTLGGGIEWIEVANGLPFPYPSVPGRPLVTVITADVFWINMLWGLFNLVPVYPLDGGQIARGLFMKKDSVTGLRNSLWLSVVGGALAAFFGMLFFESIYMAILFGMMALRSYQALHQRH